MRSKLLPKADLWIVVVVGSEFGRRYQMHVLLCCSGSSCFKFLNCIMSAVLWSSSMKPFFIMI